MFYSFVLFLIIGLCTGLFIGILFYQLNEKWHKSVEIILGLSGSLGMLVGAFYLFEISEKNEKTITAIGLYFGFILGFVIVTFLISKVLKGQKGEVSLRMMDLVLGYKQALKDYYEQRKSAVTKKFDVKEKELNIREGIISTRERDAEQEKKIINDLRQTVIEESNKLKKEKEEFEIYKNNSEGFFGVNVASGQKIYFDKNYIQNVSDYINDFHSFKKQINNETDKLIKRINDILNSTNDREKLKSIFRGYLTGICSNVIGNIFDESKKVRVHFRKQFDGNYISCAIVKKGARGPRSDYRDLNPIPISTVNMIDESFKCRKPLLKSLNPSYHYSAPDSNDKYEDYLTVAFYNFHVENHPLLSFTISISDAHLFRDKLYVICIFRLDEIIREELKRINEVIAIKDLL